MIECLSFGDASLTVAKLRSHYSGLLNSSGPAGLLRDQLKRSTFFGDQLPSEIDLLRPSEIDLLRRWVYLYSVIRLVSISSIYSGANMMLSDKSRRQTFRDQHTRARSSRRPPLCYEDTFTSIFPVVSRFPANLGDHYNLHACSESDDNCQRFSFDSADLSLATGYAFSDMHSWCSPFWSSA